MKKLNTRETFAQMLKKLRKDKGISRKTLAEDIGVSVASIGYYENGERVPDIETLVKIAGYFKVSCDEILKGVKSPNKNIYQDLWLSDKALNNLRKLKTAEPINSDTQISFLFEFFDSIISDPEFIMFLFHYYKYAIDFSGSVQLYELGSKASEEAKEYIDLFLGKDTGFSKYREYNLFAALKTLESIVDTFHYRNLREFEYYFSEKLSEIESGIKEKEVSQDGKHNPQNE